MSKHQIVQKHFFIYLGKCKWGQAKNSDKIPSLCPPSTDDRYEISGLSPISKTAGFTLLEVILAMAIMLLLAGAIYSISTASIESTKETIVEQFTMRRLAGFIQITRNAFLNLPTNGAIYLSNDSNNSIPDLNFENAAGLFGIASLGGGTLTLSAQPSSDGTRTFSILRIPKNIQGNDLNRFYEHAHWVKLLPKVQKPHWSFFNKGEWVDEWPRGTGRPQLVRLEMEVAGIHEPLQTIFYLPPITRQGLGK
jgi:prepilin-type N-terminal cleavage/methylation domain-containing protein